MWLLHAFASPLNIFSLFIYQIIWFPRVLNPRHLGIRSDTAGAPIVWFGNLNDMCARTAFEPDISMRIPAGAEFINPQPPHKNHFSNVWVFHRASKTVHNDDCVMFFDNPPFAFRLIGYRDQSMAFHGSITGPGLYPTEAAPLEVRCAR